MTECSSFVPKRSSFECKMTSNRWKIEGKCSSFCSSFKRSSKFRGSAAPADAAHYNGNAAHCSSFAAHLHGRREHDVDGVRKTTTTGTRIPTKPIGIVGVVHNLFTNFPRYNGKKKLQKCYKVKTSNLI